MTVMISNERTQEIVKSLETGHGLDQITMEEYLQVSFLSLMSEDEVHMEETIMYGGNLFTLHACVNQVNPGQQVKALRKIV